ncbi:hypothetical protein MVEN_01334300 [Mycena venus]|uniref:DUF6533 domain-containing protein n=1 Tax=Mycena venus TaxID=2733690 RepID=A0A8H6Y1W1_9AGAR|nr:hypothetical protein MVEN_01334300 [Mycena venus]
MSDSISAAEFQTQLNVNVYSGLISLTILFYDFALTLSDEIRTYWGTHTTLASVLFYLNRYVSMVGNTVPIVVENLWTTGSDFDPHKIRACRAVQTYHQYFSIIAQIFVAGLLIMRTYALYERSRRVLIFTTGIALTAVIVGAYILFSGKGNSDTVNSVYVKVGCASGLDIVVSRRFGFGWVGMLVFDVAIFVLTTWKALALSREQRGGQSLFTILVRDGSIFFFVMMASNGSNILTFFYAGLYTRGVATTFTNVISSVMISRLMLNLRLHAVEPSMRTGESTTLYDPHPPISTVIEPYYNPSTHFSDDSRLYDGRLREDDIPLEEIASSARRKP